MKVKEFEIHSHFWLRARNRVMEFGKKSALIRIKW
jgi:hypothetical protein